MQADEGSKKTKAFLKARKKVKTILNLIRKNIWDLTKYIEPFMEP